MGAVETSPAAPLTTDAGEQLRSRFVGHARNRGSIRPPSGEINEDDWKGGKGQGCEDCSLLPERARSGGEWARPLRVVSVLVQRAVSEDPRWTRAVETTPNGFACWGLGGLELHPSVS
jgi:hypothetical protein